MYDKIKIIIASATCYDWPMKKLNTNIIQERMVRLNQIGYSRMF